MLNLESRFRKESAISERFEKLRVFKELWLEDSN
jgi:hypothetical protein